MSTLSSTETLEINDLQPAKSLNYINSCDAFSSCIHGSKTTNPAGCDATFRSQHNCLSIVCETVTKSNLSDASTQTDLRFFFFIDVLHHVAFGDFKKKLGDKPVQG